MVNQQLLDYIRQCKQQGVATEEIKKTLLVRGWQTTDVEEAFQTLETPLSVNIPADVAPVTTSVVTSHDVKGKKPLNKMVMAVILIIVGLIAVGAAAAGYMYFFPSPEVVLKKMSQQLATVKTAEYRGEIKVEIPSTDFSSLESLTQSTSTPELPKVITMSVSFNGKGSLADINNTNSQFNVTLSSDAATPLGQAGTTLLGLETRTIAKVIYLKLTTLPNFGLFNLSFLTNQWIKLDLEAMQKQFAPTLNDEIPQQSLTPEQIQQIKDATLAAKFFTVTATLPGEKIEGTDTFHYGIAIDKVATKQWLQTIKNIVDKKEFTSEESQALDKALATIDLSNSEIWIGKKDFLPYKIMLTTIIKDDKKPTSETKVTSTISFKNYNQPVVIETPTESKTFEELMMQLLTGGTGNLNFSTSTPLLIATSSEAINLNKAREQSEVARVHGSMSALMPVTLLCLDAKGQLNCGGRACTSSNSLPVVGQPVCIGYSGLPDTWPVLPGSWKLRYAISSGTSTFRLYASDGTTVAAPGMSASDGYSCEDQNGCKEEAWTNAKNQGGK